ncbi:hypothetical protein HMF8227_00063 [Saliniradius amylolyticus]|uniref:Peptidase M28 domain-containing protein n=1 Tax=Saliniradius amylolyticus TaxID=2183582 RepID=A0A2S2DYU6_9ALTE|nr:M28 family metallopeptidase [Saliniradius amylolyticus]AWL10571.1 hypothetical protein HMF8227_00063 [Saliniradius amylolyticus]
MKPIILLAAVTGLVSSTLSVAATSNPEADAERIRAHVEFLADDLLRGRDTGSRGHQIATRYIASEFTQLGLEPAGEDGTFFQTVPFRQAYLKQESPRLVLSSDHAKLALDYPKDYLTGPSTVYQEAHVSGEMVFAGYGIVAPELEHDDYADLDVDGKVVVILSGKPAHFPSEEGAHFASGHEKGKHAAQRGAIGIVSITTPTIEKIRPYQSRLNYLHTPSLRTLDESGEPVSVFPEIKNSAFFSKKAAEQLFAHAPMSLDEIYAAIEQGNTPAGFALPVSIDFSKSSTHERIESDNVAAILPGSDPELKNEYVVYSAHSDHIGIAKTVKKDKINNGAMDNATGTSVLLETARLFTQMPKPRRSILFVAVTAEEKGLLGADYFARNPTVPGDAMVANVNLDMPILKYQFEDVIAFGANHSDLQHNVADAAEQMGLSLAEDPWPEQALFTRSDHYMFVKQGVPSVFLVPGFTAKGDKSGEDYFKEFLGSDYHKPSDEVNEDFNWQAATLFTEVNLRIGRSIANQDQRPAWFDGDFFGNTFAGK